MAIIQTMSDYFNRLRGFRLQMPVVNLGKNLYPADKVTPSIGRDDLVSLMDFPELVSTLMAYFPDPDTVLEKLGWNWIYYRDTLNDARVSGCLKQRKSKNQLSNLVITSGADDSQAQAARDLVEAQVMAIKRLPNVVSEILDSIFFGASYMELYWNSLPMDDSRPAGEIVLENVKAKPYEWFAYDENGVLGVKTSLSIGWGLRDIPPGKIVAAVNEGSYQNPYGDRAVKRVYWPYFFKKNGMKLWSTFLEKYGAPFLFGQLAGKASETMLVEMHNKLVEMISNGVAVARGDGMEKITAIEAGGKQSSTDAYQAFKAAWDSEIAIALLGETQTVEIGDIGSRASSEVHASVLENFQAADAKIVEGAFNEIAELITRFNFGPEVKAPKCILRDPNEIRVELATRDGTLRDKLGVAFNEQYIEDVYHIPQKYFTIENISLPPNQFGPNAMPGQAINQNGAPGQLSPENALNGAQITAAVEVIQTAIAKGIPTVAATELLVAVGIPRQTAEAMVRDANKMKTPANAEPKPGSDGQASFAEEAFRAQHDIDKYIEQSVSLFSKYTKDIQARIKAAIKESTSYSEFVVRIGIMADQIDQKEFARLFNDCLNTAYAYGTFTEINQGT